MNNIDTKSNPVTKNKHTKGLFKATSSSSVANTLAVVVSTIANAQRAGYQFVRFSPNRCGGLTVPLLTILRNEGYLNKVEISDGSWATVYLRYDGRGQPAIRSLRLVSTPSREVYLRAAALWQPQSTVGRLVLSTTEGLLTDREARRRNLGGKVIRGVRLNKNK
jgi:small subunit ribosomal protein S8